MASEWICLLVPSGDYICQRYLQFKPVLNIRENNLPLSEGLFMCSYPSYTVNELSCVFHTYWALSLTDIITSGGAKAEFLDWAVPFHLNSRPWVPVPPACPLPVVLPQGCSQPPSDHQCPQPWPLVSNMPAQLEISRDSFGFKTSGFLICLDDGAHMQYTGKKEGLFWFLQNG